jgi:peptide/nickel transport system permease protein/nickel transport system permease protein
MPVVVAFTMLAVLVYVGASLLADLVLRALDPRLRTPARAAVRR